MAAVTAAAAAVAMDPSVKSIAELQAAAAALVAQAKRKETAVAKRRAKQLAGMSVTHSPGPPNRWRCQAAGAGAAVAVAVGAGAAAASAKAGGDNLPPRTLSLEDAPHSGAAASSRAAKRPGDETKSSRKVKTGCGQTRTLTGRADRFVRLNEDETWLFAACTARVIALRRDGRPPGALEELPGMLVGPNKPVDGPSIKVRDLRVGTVVCNCHPSTSIRMDLLIT